MTAKEKGICMIAHRGYSGKYFMNTAQAFTEAAKHGSGGAETDIRITKDGVLVCSHNADAVFTDDTRLFISEATFAELTAKPLKNDKNQGDVYLCSYRTYLEIMKKYNMICFIELKGEFTQEQVSEVFETAREVYSLDKCILQSFEFDNLLKSRELFPELPLMYTYGSGQDDYKKCFEYGISLDIDKKIVTDEIIKQFRENGLEVAVWTVNDEESFEYFKNKDVDYIESDVFGGNE